VGLEADHRRALAERDRQRKNVEAAVGQLEVASAELVRRVRLDPRVVVAPVEPPEAVIRLVADGCPLDDLIVTGLRNRPELAEARALVDATLVRLKQARLRPLIPSVAMAVLGRRLRRRRQRLLRRFQRPQRHRREPLLGGAEPRPGRPGDRPPAGLPAADGDPRTDEDPGPRGIGSRPRRQGTDRHRAPTPRSRSRRSRSSRLPLAQLHQHPPGCRPARSNPDHRGAPADPGPRPGAPTTSTPSCPTTARSSDFSMPWVSRRCSHPTRDAHHRHRTGGPHELLSTWPGFAFIEAHPYNGI
jgi:hypothetical protein